MSIVPAELIDTIVDFLHDDTKSLQACALVSRPWLASAQLHLYHTVSIHSPAHGRRFLAAVEHAPDLTCLVRCLALLGSWPVEDTPRGEENGDVEYDSDATSSDDLSVYQFADDGTDGGALLNLPRGASPRPAAITPLGPIPPHAVLAALSARLVNLIELHIHTPWMDTEIALPSRDVLHTLFQHPSSLRLAHFAGPPAHFERLLCSFPSLRSVRVARVDAEPPMSLSAGAGARRGWPPLDELVLDEFVRVPGEAYATWMAGVPEESRARAVTVGVKVGTGEAAEAVGRVLRVWGARLEEVCLDVLLASGEVPPPSLSANVQLRHLRIRLHLLRPEQHLPWLEALASTLASPQLRTLTLEFVTKGFIAPAKWAPEPRAWNRLDRLLSDIESLQGFTVNVVGWNAAVGQLCAFVDEGFSRLKKRGVVGLGHSRWSDATLVNPFALPV